MNEILERLKEPFHPSRITWKPGSIRKDKTSAMALAYADLRAYQDRLDEICGMDWAVTYTPWGDKLICHVTINGVTRSSTGEPTAEAERNEIDGTVAEAQAMKRACAQWGLGRYLYEMPTMWVDWDGSNGRFTEQAKAKLNGMIAQHYDRWLKNRGSAVMVDTKTGEILLSQQEGPGNHLTQRMTNHIAATQKTQQRPAQSVTSELDTLGAKLYGEKWDEVKAHNIKRLTGKQQPASALTQEQVDRLVGGLRVLMQHRNPNPVPQDVDYYDSNEEWRGMSEEAEANERKAKAEARAFEWPTDDETLEICTGLVNSPDCDSGVTKLLVEFHALAEGSTKAMSDKQYGFLVSLLDKRYNGGHNAILSALTGMIINSNFIPGWQIKVLIDWLKEPDNNPADVLRLDAMVEALKADLQQLEVA
jgi:hypothetical protein